MRKTFADISLEDDSCRIQYCECGEEIDLFISGSHIYRCPKCNRGYVTDFTVWTFFPDEANWKWEEKDVYDEKLKRAMEVARVFAKRYT